jgi:hypothetical protein
MRLTAASYDDVVAFFKKIRAVEREPFVAICRHRTRADREVVRRRRPAHGPSR